MEKNNRADMQEVKFNFSGEPDFDVVMYYPYGWLPSKSETVSFGGFLWIVGHVLHDLENNKIEVNLKKL